MFGFVTRAKYKADVADLEETQQRLTFQRDHAQDLCRRYVTSLNDKDARIYELQENCFELTVERNALLAARQPRLANGRFGKKEDKPAIVQDFRLGHVRFVDMVEQAQHGHATQMTEDMDTELWGER